MIKHFSPIWKNLPSDKNIPDKMQGPNLDFLEKPVHKNWSKIFKNISKILLLYQGVEELLRIGAIYSATQ